MSPLRKAHFSFYQNSDDKNSTAKYRKVPQRNAQSFAKKTLSMSYKFSSDRENQYLALFAPDFARLCGLNTFRSGLMVQVGKSSHRNYLIPEMDNDDT
jgi:hypothetical protein